MPVENHKYIHEWLEHAHMDARSAIALSERGYPLQGLFFIQQSMEKALKGMLASKGLPYSELKKYGHDNLDSFLTPNRKLLDTDFAWETLQRLIDPTIVENLKQVEELAVGRRRRQQQNKDSDSFRALVATFSPADVERLMSTLQRLESATLATTEQPFKLGTPPATGDLFDWMYNQLMLQARSRVPRSQWRVPPKENFEVARDLFHLIGESRIRAGLLGATQWEVGRHFQWVIAYIAVYIIGTISWPHAVWARYPAISDAPEQAAEAARVGKMGTRHYDEQIGAVACLEMLASKAEWVTGILIECHQAGIGIFPDTANRET